MFSTAYARQGLVVAPHPLAAQAGLAVLRAGGDAIEAAVAAAAASAVVAPHQGGLGGDGFWLIGIPGQAPIAIEAAGAGGIACERLGGQRTPELPPRGPFACCTVAGAVAGWIAALEVSRGWGGRLPLARLLEDAIRHARNGFPCGTGLTRELGEGARELAAQPGFAPIWLPGGKAPPAGTLVVQAALARTLERLAVAGLEDFYQGAVASWLAADLKALGSPLTDADFAVPCARRVEPLVLTSGTAQVYSLPPPTEGLAALMMIGLFDRMQVPEPERYLHIHCAVEAAKRAHRINNRRLLDPAYGEVTPADYLLPALLDEVSATVDRSRALPWPEAGEVGESGWIAAVDAAGRIASTVHSLGPAFGSGVVLERSGVLWQAGAAGFTLEPGAFNRLTPGALRCQPASPLLARFEDGRMLALGATGGESQAQTVATLFGRHVRFAQEMQPAVTAPRWVLGKRRGRGSVTLKLEGRFAPEVVEWLRLSGHTLEMIELYAPLAGSAGAVGRRPDGVIEGAIDPRSDGALAAW